MVTRDSGTTLRNQGLRADQVAEAAELYISGRSQMWIGNHFGVSNTAVRSALLARRITMRDTHGHGRSA